MNKNAQENQLSTLGYINQTVEGSQVNSRVVRIGDGVAGIGDAVVERHDVLTQIDRQLRLIRMIGHDC